MWIFAFYFLIGLSTVCPDDRGEVIHIIKPPQESQKPSVTDDAIKVVEPPKFISREKSLREFDNFDVKVGATFNFGGNVPPREVKVAVGKPLSIADGMVIRDNLNFQVEGAFKDTPPSVAIESLQYGSSSEEFLPFFPLSTFSEKLETKLGENETLDYSEYEKSASNDSKSISIFPLGVKGGVTKAIQLPINKISVTTLSPVSNSSSLENFDKRTKPNKISSPQDAHFPVIQLPPLKLVAPLPQTPYQHPNNVISRRTDNSLSFSPDNPYGVKHQLVFVPVPLAQNRNVPAAVPISSFLAEDKSDSDDSFAMENVKQTLASAKETIMSAKGMLSGVMAKRAGWVKERLFRVKDSSEEDLNDRMLNVPHIPLLGSDNHPYDSTRVVLVSQSEHIQQPAKQFFKSPSVATHSKPQKFVVVPSSKNNDYISSTTREIIPLIREKSSTAVSTGKLVSTALEAQVAESRLEADPFQNKDNLNLKLKDPNQTREQTKFRNVKLFPFTYEDVKNPLSDKRTRKINSLSSPSTNRDNLLLASLQTGIVNTSKNDQSISLKYDNERSNNTADAEYISVPKYFRTDAPNIVEVPAPDLSNVVHKTSDDYGYATTTSHHGTFYETTIKGSWVPVPLDIQETQQTNYETGANKSENYATEAVFNIGQLARSPTESIDFSEEVHNSESGGENSNIDLHSLRPRQDIGEIWTGESQHNEQKYYLERNDGIEVASGQEHFETFPNFPTFISPKDVGFQNGDSMSHSSSLQKQESFLNLQHQILDQREKQDEINFFSSQEFDYVLSHLEKYPEIENEGLNFEVSDLESRPTNEVSGTGSSSLFASVKTGQSLLQQSRNANSSFSLFDKEQYEHPDKFGRKIDENESSNNLATEPTTKRNIVEIMPIFIQNGSVLSESKMNLDPAVYDTYDDENEATKMHRSGAPFEKFGLSDKYGYDEYKESADYTTVPQNSELKERKRKKAYYHVHEKPLKYSPKGAMYSIIQGKGKLQLHYQK
ncbi:hypothetical protein QYM36_014973 [Artemia franciscana]|uniref:Uncharacterized protein n=1 Tax=Artemia franciscana TaxID=6661 RepID=A0AA88HK38_ARTSF|nr:hypothetical protein QYM36_014973 [Artemia franciscana]